MVLENFISFIGIFILIGIGWLFSENRKKINWRLVSWGIGLQLIFALIIIKTTPGKIFFSWIKVVINTILDFTRDGADFIFGGLVSNTESFGYIFAFQVLPTIIFFSSFMSVLYHLGIMQKIVVVMAKVMTKTMKISGSESLSCAANVFVGQTEAPLVVKPYIDTMTKSEIMTLMTGGMATVAGGVMAAYAGMGINPGHLLAASIMSAPAAIVMAKIMIPETEKSKTAGGADLKLEKTSVNVIDAAANGAAEGVQLAINVAAMLLAFISLIAMANFVVTELSMYLTGKEVTIQQILGYIFSPLAYIMGVPKEDIFKIGQLLGIKTVVNEFVAYADLSNMLGSLSKRSILIATYALCGFANFSSIAIQIGGVGSLAPGKKHMLAKLGIRSMIGGTLAAFLTATIASMIISEKELVEMDSEKAFDKTAKAPVVQQYDKNIDYNKVMN